MTTEQTTQSSQAPPAHAQAPPAHAQGIGREARLRAVLGTGLLVLAVGTGILFADPFTVGALVAIVALLYIFRAVVFSWPGAAVALVFVVCLVPARRYTLPISLPFAADPYRILVLLLLAAVVGALLIDPTFRWRQLEFGAPVGVFLATQLISIGTNVPGLVTSQLAPNAVISLVSLLIICAVFLVTRQIIQSRALLDLTIVTLVLSGTFVGALATVERVTRVNLFLDFFALLPLQRLSQEESVFVKAGTARAFASAQHPIALAVFLVMLVPLGVYLARHATWPHRPGTRELFWIGCTMIMVLGTLAAVSRTAFVSIAVMIVFVVLIRPVIVPRLLFYGLLASAASLAISARNVIGMITELLNPQALIESQMSSPGWTGSGRLADLGPSLEQAAHSPLFGTGLGSRITIGPSANAFILDDQYLTTLLESGIVGVVGLVLLLLIPIGRLAAFAKRAGPPDDRRDLALAVATAFIGYGVALAFFDGLSFIQTVLTFFLLLAFGSWAIGADHERAPVERAILRMRVPT